MAAELRDRGGERRFDGRSQVLPRRLLSADERQQLHLGEEAGRERVRGFPVEVAAARAAVGEWGAEGIAQEGDGVERGAARDAEFLLEIGDTRVAGIADPAVQPGDA